MLFHIFSFRFYQNTCQLLDDLHLLQFDIFSHLSLELAEQGLEESVPQKFLDTVFVHLLQSCDTARLSFIQLFSDLQIIMMHLSFPLTYLVTACLLNPGRRQPHILLHFSDFSSQKSLILLPDQVEFEFRSIFLVDDLIAIVVAQRWSHITQVNKQYQKDHWQFWMKQLQRKARRALWNFSSDLD